MKDGWSRLVTEEELRLLAALELAEEAAHLLLRTGVIKQEYRDRALTMLDRARAGRSVSAPVIQKPSKTLGSRRRRLLPIVGKCRSCGRDTIRASGDGYLCSNIDCQAVYKKSVPQTPETSEVFDT